MKSEVYVPSGVPVIRGTNISSDRELGGEWVYISEAFADAMPRCVVRAGDLVFPHRGSIGEVALVPSNRDRYFLSTSCMKITLDRQKADPRYVAYYFKSDAGRAEIMRFASQVGTPGIGQPLTSLRQFNLPAPPVYVQEAIADLLSHLDDKIDLNRRMAETLEGTIRTLFKSWFVDFDPVHAKIEGRPSDLSDELAALFSDSFGEDGLPSGWYRQKLTKFLTVTKGNSYKSVHLAPSQTALVTLKSFMRGGGYRADGLKSFTGPYKEAQIVKPGELIVAGTDVTQAAEVIGQPALVQADDRYSVLVASLDTFILRACSHAPWLWSLFLAEQGFPSFARGYTTGTTVLHLSPKVFDDFAFVVPSNSALIARAEQALGDIQARITHLSQESRVLAKLRDTLLPKLISGELRITEAERKVFA
ncbi:restriction endonuclease subunit S [Bradyrhizobium stylosanthis]|nr:restriction endonuclease subunit S [Bradyrhizobium stylosanthis]